MVSQSVVISVHYELDFPDIIPLHKHYSPETNNTILKQTQNYS